MIALAAALALLAAPTAHHAAPAAAAPSAAIAELRAAEAHLIVDLEGDDRFAWVKDYSEDAVFQEGSDDLVSGRAAMTELARSMKPLSSVSIDPVRTEIAGKLA